MNIEKAVAETIKKYRLMKKSDKVVVALSGGKDSTSVIYILKKQGYNVHGLMIDLYLGEWSKIHNEKMTAFCKEQDIPLTIVDLKKEIGQGICFVKAVLAKKKGLTGCTVCGIVKRWVLNRWARKLGGDVIVTGHNLDDEAQNVLMNFLKGNIELGVGMGPATGRSNVDGFVQRVKPLFFVPESEIMKYARGKKFDILYDKCPCAFGTYRVDTREWMSCLKDLEKRKIVDGFMDEIASRGSVVGSREVRKCSECGEVSRGRVCKFCEIVKNIN
ncbi:adenine nucleotide alpha hydrolase family protein [Methanococcoides sp. SA1]|nr:adenine nucleotide alpha hydrolase family protein [Methanococcoides sp. SA1]